VTGKTRMLKVSFFKNGKSGETDGLLYVCFGQVLRMGAKE